MENMENMEHMENSNLKKNYIIAAIVVVIIIVVIVLSSRKSDDAPVNASTATSTSSGQATTTASSTPVKKQTVGPLDSVPAPKGTVYINYTSKGFVPALIEVKQGASVRFTNKSTASMMLLIDDRIVGNIYSGFGQDRSVGNGGMYDFTFTLKGAYTIINNNNQAHKLVIVVK